MKFIFCLPAVFIISSVSLAQSVSLRGQVTDQNGAVIPKARVTLDGPSGLVKTGATDDRGGYPFTELPLTKTLEFGGERGSAATAQRGPGGGEGRPVPGVFGAGAGTPGSSSSAQAGRRYNLSISMSVRNLLNHNNPGPIIGNITSPLFGQANQPAGGGGFIFSEAANNRRLELQMRFSF
jgi:hypothetical protein